MIIKMQAAMCLSPLLPLVKPKATKNGASASAWAWKKSTPRLWSSMRATANENSSVDYSSITSVFPAEACETIGGEACEAEMYPEVKIKSESDATKITATASEIVDREYLEYNSPKTVFPAEACDDLGGEFCEPDYQKGVY